jgi:hypothetical protein
VPFLSTSRRLLEVIGAVDPNVLQFSKILEMQRTMLVIIETLKIAKLAGLFLNGKEFL